MKVSVVFPRYMVKVAGVSGADSWSSSVANIQFNFQYTFHYLYYSLWCLLDPIAPVKKREPLESYFFRLPKRHVKRLLNYWLFLLPEIDHDLISSQYEQGLIDDRTFAQLQRDVRSVTSSRLKMLNAASLVFSESELIEIVGAN